MTNPVSGGVPPLVRADDPILRKRARELTDRERAHTADGLIAQLFAVMEANNGAGLAAPQIGESLRVFVMGAESFVNPVITERSAETVVYEEGCLSLPGILVDVPRNVSITLQTAGRIVRLTGQSARIAQHEIDHLDGKLITDYAALGGVPEQGLREAAQALLDECGSEMGNRYAYPPSNGAIDRLWAALERPRPALPPDTYFEDAKRAGEASINDKALVEWARLRAALPAPEPPGVLPPAAPIGWQTCPLCLGRGMVTFNPATPTSTYSADAGPWTCPACDGQRVLPVHLHGGAALPPQTGNPPPVSLTAFDVWEVWCSGMRAQGRFKELIARERLEWATLPEEDKLLDEYIAARLMVMLRPDDVKEQERVRDGWNAIWDGNG